MRGRGRRGPGLLGTAVVVGGAAHMGAKSAQRSQAAAQQEAPDAQIAELRLSSGSRPQQLPLPRRPSPTTPRRSRSTRR